MTELTCEVWEGKSSAATSVERLIELSSVAIMLPAVSIISILNGSLALLDAGALKHSLKLRMTEPLASVPEGSTKDISRGPLVAHKLAVSKTP